MAFRGDERAQSIQIGAILLFGVLIIAFVGYQVSVVPQQNEGVEYAHSQDVQADMVDLRNGVLRTAATGQSAPVAVDLGPTYPPRAVFVNPGPPAGSLETVDLAPSGNQINITNAQALDTETADYWGGSPHRFDTKGIQYVPRYNLYPNAPTTVYENSVLYNRFDRAKVSDDAMTVDGDVALNRTGQTLVNGRTITLVATQGDRDVASVETVSVDPEAISAPMRTVAVTDSGSPITIRVPTRLSADTWTRLLQGETYVDTSSIRVNNGILEFALQPGETYNLRLAGVSVGDSTSTRAESYVVPVSSDGATVSPGGTQEFVVEVRDQFNNPISGVQVSVASVSDGSVNALSPTTDENGRATFTYTAPSSSGPQQVVVGFDGESNPDAPKAAELDFTVQGSGGGPSYTVDWVDPANSPGAATNPGESCAQIPCAPLPLFADTTPDQPGAPVGFGTSDSSVATFDPSVAAADSSGRAKGGLVFEDTGSSTLYASSGGNSDTLPVTTFINDGFEDGTLAPWQPFVQGSYEDGQPSVDDDEYNGGSEAAVIDSVNDGGIVTSNSYDTSNANLIVVEYWAMEDGVEHDDTEGDEDLVLEFLSASGSWERVDRLKAETDDGDEYHRRVRINSAAALHSGFKLRFRQLAADAPSDAWYVDDVTFSRIGGTGSGTNAPPTADFEFAPSNPDVGEQVDFTDQSSDIDGSITSWSWDFGDGASSTSQNPSHTFTSSGTYTVSLQVTDDSGATNTYSETIEVNANPSADANGPYEVDEGSSVTLSGTGSSDPDGSIATYEWQIVGSAPSGVSITDGDTSTPGATLDASGADVDADATVTVKLTVTDDDGATASDTAVVTVRNAGLRFVSGSGQATGPGSDTSGISFDIKNTGSENIEVTEIRIDGTTTDASHVRELTWGEGRFAHEVFIYAQGSATNDQKRDGYLETGGLDYYEIGTREALTDTATLEGRNNNNDATVYIYEFFDGDTSGRDSVPMGDEEVTITLYYQIDGDSTESVTFTVFT